MLDVANTVGVSKQTVSAVINGKPGITDATKKRVLVACEQLGYHLDLVARSLATGRTGNIALIVSDTSTPFIGKLAVAIEDLARQSGYSLMVFNTHDIVDREVNYFKAAIERGIDGGVFISATDECSGLEILQEAGIPYVATDRIPYPYDGPAVTLDNVKVGRLAAEHLLSLGHTQLAHISGPNWVRMSRERLEGFKQVLTENRILTEMRIELAETWDYSAGYKAMQCLMNGDNKPTAVFAAADMLAIGAMRAVQEAGCRVPEDISVVGVDDIDIAAFQNPSLTTIRQSIAELAELSFKLLLGILEGNVPDQTQIVMQPILVIRESTTAVRV
jgi:DNA-binding LacI/PurR family transcriptional regulator